jgi:hypothetical protein
VRKRKTGNKNRTFEEWKNEQRQMTIPFDAAEIVEPTNTEE